MSQMNCSLSLSIWIIKSIRIYRIDFYGWLENGWCVKCFSLKLQQLSQQQKQPFHGLVSSHFSILLFLFRCNYEKIISVIHRLYVPHSMVPFAIHGQNNDMIIILCIKYERNFFLPFCVHASILPLLLFNAVRSLCLTFIPAIARKMLYDCRYKLAL